MPSNSTGFCVAMTMKGLGSEIGLAVHRHLPLAHGFQQRALRARRGPVDLVGQHDIGEDRAAVESEFLRAAVEHAAAGNVGGKQVRSELDAAEFARYAPGHGLAGQGLAHAGHVFQKHVLARQQRHHRQPDDFVLAQHDLADVILEFLDEIVILIVHAMSFQLSVRQFSVKRLEVGIAAINRATAYVCSICNLKFAIDNLQ